MKTLIPKSARQILDYMISKSDGQGEFFDSTILWIPTKQDFHGSQAAVRYLVDNGFASVKSDNPSLIRLELRGRCYKEFIGLETRERVASYLWGIVSGIAVTLLTTWLTGLLRL